MPQGRSVSWMHPKSSPDTQCNAAIPMDSQQKMQHSAEKQLVQFPGSLHPRFLVFLINSLLSSFSFIALWTSSYCQKLQSSTLTDFYVVSSAFAVVCLLLLTVMTISDPSTQVLIEKGNCYFHVISFRKKTNNNLIFICMHMVSWTV